MAMAFEWVTAENVDKYQGLIGTLVGFGGVMLTLWWNARLNRRQHERNFEQQRAAVVVALHAELKQNGELCAENLRGMENLPEGVGLRVPTE
jgi:hypothetical protein